MPTNESVQKKKKYFNANVNQSASPIDKRMRGINGLIGRHTVSFKSLFFGSDPAICNGVPCKKCSCPKPHLVKQTVSVIIDNMCLFPKIIKEICLLITLLYAVNSRSRYVTAIHAWINGRHVVTEAFSLMLASSLIWTSILYL